MNILVVDDDESHRQLIKRHIERIGHSVLAASDGQSAWELLQAEQVQVVITDWEMPVLNGIGLIERIRAANFSRYVYIMLLTIRTDRRDILDGLQAGADDYLIKPCEYRELRLRIEIGIRIVDLENRLRTSLDQLYQLVTYDTVTELLNRHAISQHAEAEMARSRRELSPLSFLVLHVDSLTTITNDHGQPAGDQALRLVAQIVQRSIRPYDRAGRWGSAEFLIVLSGADASAAAIVAQRIRANVDAVSLDLSPDQHLSLHVHLGSATTTSQPPVTLSTLISLADSDRQDHT